MKIEKGIQPPLSDRKEKSGRKYPFGKMEVGDSILDPDGNSSQSKSAKAAYAWGRRNGAKFVAKSVDGGVRIWRVS